MRTPLVLVSIYVAQLLLADAACADAVDVSEAGARGGGLAVSRGGNCFVVTAAHVVSEAGNDLPVGPEIIVADQSAAKAEGKRVFYDESNDLAVFELPRKTPIACSSRWEDPAWMRGRKFSPSDEFHVVRGEPGKETIFLFRYAGGSARELELAPKDKFRIKQSDSGSPVFVDGKFAGILSEVQTADDRIVMVRADLIDDKAGHILRGRGLAERSIGLEPVTYNGRPYEDWTIYTREELAKAGHGTIVTGDVREASCTIAAKVIAIGRTNAPNPQYAQTQSSYQNMCSRERGGFAKLMCQNYQEQLKTMPRQVTVWTVEVDVAAARPGEAALAELGSHKFQTAEPLPVDVMQRSVIGKSVAATTGKLIAAGACD